MYVTAEEAAEMLGVSTGYYELDRLPEKCANNYIYCNDTNGCRTNIFSVDVKGTGAGGAFITVKDIVAFWTNLLEGNEKNQRSTLLIMNSWISGET